MSDESSYVLLRLVMCVAFCFVRYVSLRYVTFRRVKSRSVVLGSVMSVRFCCVMLGFVELSSVKFRYIIRSIQWQI